MIMATTAIRDWINTRSGLTADALTAGAYLKSQASPDSGAYAVLERTPSSLDLTAEPGPWDVARIAASIRAGTMEAAEKAATAYRDKLQTLLGDPEPMGDMVCLATDNVSSPALLPVPGNEEQYQYLVTADFLLMEQP